MMTCQRYSVLDKNIFLRLQKKSQHQLASIAFINEGCEYAALICNKLKRETKLKQNSLLLFNTILNLARFVCCRLFLEDWEFYPTNILYLSTSKWYCHRDTNGTLATAVISQPGTDTRKDISFSPLSNMGITTSILGHLMLPRNVKCLSAM